MVSYLLGRLFSMDFFVYLVKGKRLILLFSLCLAAAMLAGMVHAGRKRREGK